MTCYFALYLSLFLSADVRNAEKKSKKDKMMENLEFNRFFNSLRTEFSREFEEAQEKRFTVFIPTDKSLNNVILNKQFVHAHLAKPSSYFQGEYEIKDDHLTRILQVENGVIHRSIEFGDLSEVKIIGEETAYSQSGKSYCIYLIDKPLKVYSECDKEVNLDELKENEVCDDWLNGSQCPSIAQCKVFIEEFDGGNVLKKLDENLEIILKNYIFLADYLEDTAEKIRKLIDSTIQDAVEKERCLGPKTITALPLCVECYVLNRIHDVLFPLICSRFRCEDEQLSAHLLRLHNKGVSPVQLGTHELFSCPSPASVVELARLPSLTTPRHQLQCIKNTIDLLSAEIKQHLMESRGFLTLSAHHPCVTADDLIPALSSIIIKSKLPHLSSAFYYMENFAWSVSVKDIYGYALVSFKAAVTFVRSLHVDQLPVSRLNSSKKELSFEELMEATGEMEEGRRSTSGLQEGPVDKQMEKMLKMLEASTRELSQVQHQGFSSF